MFSEEIAETSEIACPERYLPFREPWISGGSQTLPIAPWWRLLIPQNSAHWLFTLFTLFTFIPQNSAHQCAHCSHYSQCSHCTLFTKLCPLTLHIVHFVHIVHIAHYSQNSTQQCAHCSHMAANVAMLWCRPHCTAFYEFSSMLWSSRCKNAEAIQRPGRVVVGDGEMSVLQYIALYCTHCTWHCIFQEMEIRRIMSGSVIQCHRPSTAHSNPE